MCVSGRVVLEGVNSHSCVRSNWRGFQSFLWQTKSKQNGWKNARVGDWEKRAAKTANNLIMSLSSLSFQANDYHMQTRTLGKIKTARRDKGTDPADRAVAPPLQLRGNFAARRGENTPASSVLSLQHYPTESSRRLSPLFVAALSNRANELRGRRWERLSGTERGKNPLSILLQDKMGG